MMRSMTWVPVSLNTEALRTKGPDMGAALLWELFGGSSDHTSSFAVWVQSPKAKQNLLLPMTKNRMTACTKTFRLM